MRLFFVTASPWTNLPDMPVFVSSKLPRLTPEESYTVRPIGSTSPLAGVSEPNQTLPLESRAPGSTQV